MFLELVGDMGFSVLIIRLPDFFESLAFHKGYQYVSIK
jgi:hypothetical protein